MTRALGLVSLCVVLAACPAQMLVKDAGQPPPPPPPRDSGMSVDAGDPTVEIFAPDHLLDVHIELAANDWDALRAQTRDILGLLSGDCTAQPFPSPFTTFPATATIDGKTLTQITVKKKGFLGSLSATRPSLKLKFDDTLEDQEVSGLDAMTLNNAQQDPAIVRQCLGYALFAEAGLVAPRCNFAHVFVNGEDLGVYVHVEGIDKDLLKRHFEKSKGNLYEGTISDFNTTFVRTFDLKDDKTDRSDLQGVVNALNGPDAMLETRLRAVIDLDQFIDFWAMETLVRHWDGYAGNTNNFFVYADPTSQRMKFIPWGADAVFYVGAVTDDQPEGPLLRGDLSRRLYAVPELRALYIARVNHFLTTVFNETILRSELTRMQAIVTPIAHPIQAGQLATGLAGVRSFIDTRRARLTQLLASPPAGPTSSRPSPCFARLGTFTSDFQTTWGTLGAQNPFATGPATFALALDAGVLPFMFTGASAGIDNDGNDGPRVGINLVAANLDGGYTAAVIRLVPGLYPPGNASPQPFDLYGRVGYVLQYSGGVVVPIGLFGNGTLTMSNTSQVDGGTLTGRVQTEVLSWPFGGGM